MDITTKECAQCGLKKDISKFEWCKNRPNPRKICKKCKNKNNWESIKSNEIKHKEFLKNRKDHRSNNKDIYKSRWMSSVYGITLDEFNNIIKSQNNKCKICNKEFESTKTTHLDHNHNTSQIRGVLCSSCNSGIGLLKENIDTLESAIKYLKFYSFK